MTMCSCGKGGMKPKGGKGKPKGKPKGKGK